MGKARVARVPTNIWRCIISFPWSETKWQEELSAAVQDPKELLQLLNLDISAYQNYFADKSFKLRVPRSFVARMQKNNPSDPLFLQVWPSSKEGLSAADYSFDPLQEQDQNQLPGLLHKYSNRVLLITSGACAIHCRYCFRRHFDYAENNPGRKGWNKTFEYIEQHPSINEVILSGGDPLMMNDQTLAAFVQEIAKLTQIQRLRFHTRLPVVIPERITQGFLTALKTRLQTVIVFHFNHPNEIDETVKTALTLLQDAGITLLNQSVLLKGINDCSDVLSQLSESLFKTGVLPYYLHLLDKVQGSSHFAVSRQKAKNIFQELMAKLPGYLVPKLVEERAGERSKTLVM